MTTLIHEDRHGGQLWQGGAKDVAEHGAKFDTVILCAEEWQPSHKLLLPEKTRVIYAPNDDSPTSRLTRKQVSIAINAAGQAASDILKSKRVLSSCWLGKNRSGLVSALTLHLLYDLTGEEARRIVRSKVPDAISNTSFTAFLHALRKRG